MYTRDRLSFDKNGKKVLMNHKELTIDNLHALDSMWFLEEFLSLRQKLNNKLGDYSRLILAFEIIPFCQWRSMSDSSSGKRTVSKYNFYLAPVWIRYPPDRKESVSDNINREQHPEGISRIPAGVSSFQKKLYPYFFWVGASDTTRYIWNRRWS